MDYPCKWQWLHTTLHAACRQTQHVSKLRQLLLLVYVRISDNILLWSPGGSNHPHVVKGAWTLEDLWGICHPLKHGAWGSGGIWFNQWSMTQRLPEDLAALVMLWSAQISSDTWTYWTNKPVHHVNQINKRSILCHVVLHCYLDVFTENICNRLHIEWCSWNEPSNKI